MHLQLKATAVLALVSLVAAHAPHGHNHARLARRAAVSASSTSSASATAKPSASASASHSHSLSTPAPSKTPAPSAATPSTPAPAQPTPPAAPAAPAGPSPSGAPGAVPVASINPTEPSPVTHALPVTPTAGSIPSNIPNAPPLPDISNWDETTYPPLDKPPPTDSPEVQQWLAEVQASGIEIPDIAVTLNPEGNACDPAGPNAYRIGNETECWWTCGHCARTTDITACNTPLTWGSSFDDGPAPYTPDLLNFLTANQLQTTFFVVGSRVADRPNFLQTEYMMGHQIAVHTWSHTHMTSQTTIELIAELGWSKKVIKDAIGVTPNFMRPPYGDIDDRVRAISLAMGLQPVIWTVGDTGPFDTFDWEVPGGEQTAQQAITQFDSILTSATRLNTGFIVLEHDLWAQEVELATGYFLPAALAQTPKLTIQPIRQCIGLQPGDSYVETNNNSTHPPIGGVGLNGGAGSQSGQGGQGSGAPPFLTYHTTSMYLGMVFALAIGVAGLF